MDKIEALEPAMQALSDEEFQAKTPEFKEKLGQGRDFGRFNSRGLCCGQEASRKSILGMRHFRVQLIGGVVLHQGRIAEMKTGEGKTLAATLPAYLNALTGKGVHIVTVNDYLAQRDSEWMGKIYKFMGLSVGLIVHDMNSSERRKTMGQT